jgi:hypothetical protein
MTERIEGIDAAWSRPTPAELKEVGKRFIIGYVSHDPSKNLTKANCEDYLAAGIDVGLIWETTATRALSGATGGRADGIEARRQARLLGYPDGKSIGFAVDFQATQTQLTGPVRAYGVAFRQDVGISSVYGGKATIKYFVENDLADFFWQTYAWSTAGTSVLRMQQDPYDIGWVPAAHVQQYHNGVNIAGHDTDLDRALVADFGQWTATENIVTAPTPQQNAKELMSGLQEDNKNKGYTGKVGITAGTDLGGGADAARNALAQSKANGASLSQILAKLDSMTGGTIDLDQLRQIVAEEVVKALNKTGSTFVLHYTETPTTITTSTPVIATPAGG